MSETSPAQEPDDLPVLLSLPPLFIGSNGIPHGGLTVVAEDGRPLRITAARYAEITVAGEGA